MAAFGSMTSAQSLSDDYLQNVEGDTFLAQKSLPLDPRVALSDSVFDQRLIGFWEHRNESGTVTLEIVSDHVLLISGQTVQFEAAPGVLRINDKDYGIFNYPYDLSSDRLTVTFTDDTGQSYDLSFRRAREVKSGD